VALPLFADVPKQKGTGGLLGHHWKLLATGRRYLMSTEIQNFKFDQPTSGVSFERLEAIEHELGGVLDDGFRELLSMINGGRPDPGLVSSIRFLEYPIIVFLGLDEGKSNLIGSHKDLSQTIGRSDVSTNRTP
jgi:hypothetical protein